LVYALAAALGLSLIVIAFLLGRESSHHAEPPDAGFERSAASALGERTREASPNEERRWPEWADLDEWEPSETEARLVETDAGRIERHPDGRILLSNRNLDGSTHSPTTTAGTVPATETRPAGAAVAPTSEGDVVEYFRRVDAVRSSNDATDPNAFAMDLIKATMKGSTDGFDQLIEDSDRMRREMAAIEPPTECRAYHAESLAALDEGRAILETMKSAIQAGDIQALTQITQRAGALQAKADTLEALRGQILANARE
jgi:hypothetical protein